MAELDSEAEDGRATAEDAEDREMDDMDIDLRTRQLMMCVAEIDDATNLDMPEAMEPEAMEEAEAEGMLIIELVIEPDIIDIESIDPDMAEGADIIDIIDMEEEGIMEADAIPDIMPESMADLYTC